MAVWQESIQWSLSNWRNLEFATQKAKPTAFAGPRLHERPKMYLQSSCFFIVIDIQPTSAGERRGKQMKSENCPHYER